MWDERYGDAGQSYGTRPNDFLSLFARVIPPGGAVLCLAEGEGRNAMHLAALGYRVTGVDASRVAVENARRFAEERGLNVTFVHADLNTFEIAPTAWDGIVSIWAHLPPELRARVHRSCVRGLRPQGVLLLEAYTPEQLQYRTGGPPTADLMMTLAELREELRGLKLLHGMELLREIAEGRFHLGTSAVVQVVAKREGDGTQESPGA